MLERILNPKSFALGAVVLAAGAVMPAEAQISTKLRTASGWAWMAEVSKWGGYINIQASRTCDPNNLEGCIIAMDSTLIPGWMPNIYNGNANAQKLSVSGHIHGMYGNGDINGGASSNFTTNLYADVPAGANLKVTVGGDLHLDWNSVLGGGWSYFGFTSPVESTSSVVGYNPILLSATFNERKVLSAKSRAEANAYIEEGGKRYHYIGQFYSSGETRLDGSGSGASAAGYSSVIDNISVRYTGKVLTVNDGDNQTWLTGQPLPKDLSVKVADSETGVLASSVPITFTLLDPVNGARFSNNQTSIVANTAAGIAAVKLTLGASTGTYKVKATCPDTVCVPDAKEVTFTATAMLLEQGRELRPDISDLHGALNQKLSPFRVRVYNSITRGYEKDINIRYKWLSFTSTTGVTYSIPDTRAPKKANLSPENKVTGPEGFSSTYLTLGEKAGIYTVDAVCDTCLAQKEVICRGYAHEKQITAGVEPDESANPYDRDPVTGKPLTPVLRITEITTQNDHQSFTTDLFENFVRLKAELLPQDLDGSGIAWTIEDAPEDFINSGILSATKVGPETEAYVNLPQVPAAPVGRPLPLKYKVQAKAVVDGKPVYSRSRPLKQDEIDKCRQEYLDYATTPKLDFASVPRSTFTAGVSSDFVKSPFDCYAYIYPTRAQDVLNLRTWSKTNHPDLAITVTSGYRSPRKNLLWTKDASGKSWHMYGKAVDIAVDSDEHKKLLWEKTDNPKIDFPRMLERNTSPNIILKYVSSTGLTELLKEFVKPDLDLNNNKIPDRDEDENKNNVPDTLEGMAWETLKQYLVLKSTNMPNIIHSADWIHLGR